jgi:hypothetical protein
MNESVKPTPFLSVDFGENAGRHDWMSYEEATNWISQLQNKWNWISQQRHTPTNQVWQSIANTLNGVTNTLHQAQTLRNQGHAQNADNHIATARSTLEGFVRGNPWLLSNSAQSHFVEELRDAGKALEAALIVCHWMGHQDLSGVPIRPVVSGLLQWELYERGIKDRMKTENAALKRLVGDMQTALSQLQAAERTQTVRFENLHGSISEQTAKQQIAFDEGQQVRNEGWEKQLGETQGELNRLKETYDKHMALAAPVEYWDIKRKRHGRWALVSFIAIVVGMFSAAWFLHSELQSVGQIITASKVATTTAQVPPSVPSRIQSLIEPAAGWRIGSFILLATLCFWFIRLLVRIFLSNLHLENDAAERVTMAKTYLALIRNDDLPKGDNINTVLAALFRPTGDGIVRDDGIPPSTLEWFTKLGR